MKKLAAREAALLTLPVLLLGGGAWWMGRGGKLPQFHNPSDAGPMRVEITPFQPAPISPYQAWQGYEWGVTTKMSVLGDWKMPPGWKPSGIAESDSLQIVVKRNGVWKALPRKVAERLIERDGLLPYMLQHRETQYTIRINTRQLPRDAQEVRLRGYLQYQPVFTGPYPPGWTPPKDTSIRGSTYWIPFESKPFDIPIVKPNEPWPRVRVLKVSPLQFVDAKWFVDRDLGTNYFLLRLRRNDGVSWSKRREMFFARNQVQDASGWVVPENVLESSSYATSERGNVSPQLPLTDEVVNFATDHGGMDEHSGLLKPPLRLRALLTDRECWPLSIDVRVPRVDMKRRDFGAAK